MELFEKVEKIREKTGVSYEEAKEVLEKSDGDILDAIVYLERMGKVEAPKTESKKSEEFEQAQARYEKKTEEKKCEKAAKKFGTKCKEILEASISNTFTISRYNERVATIPVLVLILLLIFAFYVTLPLLIVGLFFDFKYSFQGFSNVSVDINNVCDKASDICSDIKDDVVSHKND